MVIDISSRLQSPVKRNLYKIAAPLIERGLAIRDFNDLCERTKARYREHPDYPSARAWFSSALSEVPGRYEADLPANFNVPAEGPLIIVSNHPFGILDPVILGDFISQWRPYVRFMTNFLLGEMEEMKPWIIPVDPFNGENSAQRNLGPMKEALRFLKQGGALTIFPSGEVAHYKVGQGIQESPWSPHVGALVRRTQATVLPVFFEGNNSMLFQTAGLVHPMLRTGLLLRELFSKSRETVRLRVGQPIPFSRLKKFEDDEALTRYLRLHTFVLSQRPRAIAKTSTVSEPEVAEAAAAIVSELPASEQADFDREIEALRASDSVLAKQGNLSVFVAAAPEIPHLLREIGRLRELTFRTVGEGTGEEIDLDRFDDYYLHLFLWDEQQRRVAGAYRLGRADMILRRYGAKGLYTSTLFKFQKPFLQHLDDAVEMGRSFIVPHYQRNLGTLPLLWKGIATWMARNPHYKKLFGPVSISNDYLGLSRKLMVEYFSDNLMHRELATLVKPRKPFRYFGRKGRILREFISADLNDVDDFSALISSMEEDGKGIPVLLKHYLRLNGTLLSFNVDKSFSSCLDGLIMVDITETEPRLMAKYMGEEACAKYFAHHGKPITPPAAKAKA